MADSSASTASSSAQHIDVDIDEDVRAAGNAEPKDEDMGGDSTPAAATGAQTPQSVDSDLASTFHTTSSSAKKRPPTASRLAQDVADEDDDMMEPELPSREERLLDDKIRARYIQEIGDIF